MAKAPAPEETETVEAPAQEGPTLNVNLGGTPPDRLFSRNGAGRTRKDNPFDAVMETVYQSPEWAHVYATSTGDQNGEYDAELAKTYVAQIGNAADQYKYGRKIRVDEETGIVWFKIQNKSKRGRPAGSKKGDDGNFYAPGTDGFQEHVVNAGLSNAEDDTDEDDDAEDAELAEV